MGVGKGAERKWWERAEAVDQRNREDRPESLGRIRRPIVRRSLLPARENLRNDRIGDAFRHSITQVKVEGLSMMSVFQARAVQNRAGGDPASSSTPHGRSGRSWPVVAWLVMLGLTGWGGKASAQDYQRPEDVDFTVFASDGSAETRSLSEFKGKIVALYYFSPW